MATPRTKKARVQFRTTTDRRRLIDRAVEAESGTLTEFAETTLVVAAQRVLADRNKFSLPTEALAEWEALNERPARELPGLPALLGRGSCFGG